MAWRSSAMTRLGTNSRPMGRASMKAATCGWGQGFMISDTTVVSSRITGRAGGGQGRGGGAVGVEGAVWQGEVWQEEVDAAAGPEHLGCDAHQADGLLGAGVAGEGEAQGLAHFLLERAAVLQGAGLESGMQGVVELADQQACHGGGTSGSPGELAIT